MYNLNRISVLGNMVADPQIRETAQLKMYALFTVATARDVLDVAGGVKRKEKQFHYCIAWGRLAELVMKLARRSSPVYVDGEMTYYEYLDANGKSHRKAQIVVSSFIILETAKESEALFELDQRGGDLSVF